ncbi:MAG TPA: aminomethyl-transferring glycine dehydrogenase subunit GcvPA [Peptococcaceae bacterium]|nr:aminomethyl-transferring glycine dehydrogenase subunit GcvPA [Peptococcaceae bacterium]
MSRYISNTALQQEEMLKEIGLNSLEELFRDIPKEVRLKQNLNLPEALSEMDLLKHLKALAGRNNNLEDNICFLGAGVYDHFIPSVIDTLISRQEFYTAYTPYQPEFSQGTLQAIFEFQTMMCELTGMEISNASMYDGASALAEAMLMACQAVKRDEVLVASSVHPESREVLKTYARARGIKVKEIGFINGTLDLEELKSAISSATAALLVQYPNFLGAIESLPTLAEIAHNNKALFVVSADPIALALLKSPGECGADIVVGEGQSLGNPLSFGGPHLGFFCATEKLLRKMPGRIVGQTTDKKGRRSFTLTIQAREQHIRREKATSNICSNHALNALTATIYLTLLGKEGLKEVAYLCLQKAHYAMEQITKLPGFDPLYTAPFFKEFAVKTPVSPEDLNANLLESKIIGGYPLQKVYPELKNTWLLAVTEKRTKEEIDLLVEKVGGK